MQFYEITKNIDNILSRPEECNRESLLSLLKSDLSIEKYFFSRVSNVYFFYILKDNYFKPKSISFDDKGNAFFWNVLDYLERVSEQLSDPANQRYAKELLDIIENTVQYSRTGHRINNYHIWWYFVKILNNIPVDLIINNSLTSERFETWLEEWTITGMSGDLAISDIVELLLGKFLKDDRAIKHAESIIKVITRIEKKGKKDSFSRRDEAKMVWSSYWILDGLRKNNKGIGEKCSNDIIFDIADSLNLALKYKQADYYRFIVIEKDIYRLKVCRLEKEGLREKEIGFKEGYFKCILEQYDEKQIKGLENIYNNLYQLHHIGEPEKKIDEFEFKKYVKNKEEFRKELESELKRTIGLRASNSIVNYDKKLEELYEGLNEDYSQVWFRSLADNSDVHASGADDVLAIILRDILLSRCESRRGDGKKVLKEFLTERYGFPIFKRLGLLCMNKFWGDYKDLFKEFLDAVPDVLDQSEYEVEFYDILKNYNKDLDVEVLKRLIENVPEYYREEGKQHEARWKYRWLSALKGNNLFSDWYEKEKKDAELKEDKEYEPHRSAFIRDAGPVVHKPPIAKEEILKMEIADIVKFMNEFEGATGWDSLVERKPDKKGLADAFQQAVKENPKKFSDEIKLFHKAPYNYIHSMLRGFLDVWRGNRDIDWENIFSFCEEYINRFGFIEEALNAQGSDSGGGKYIWILEVLCDLIEESSRKDERVFDKKYFPQVERLYSLMLGKTKGEAHPDAQRDAMTYALNTTLGRLIRSYIIFSLHIARVNNGQENNWGEIKYDRFFEKGIEAYIWFGMFFPNMNYLDKDWAEKKIKQLKDKGVKDFQWQRFMEAYLFGSHVYNDIYKLMQKHYEMAVDTKFDKEIDMRLVQHITIGYLRGLEALDEKNQDSSDSLFWKMLNDIDIPEKRDRWEKVASFLWSVTGRSKRHAKEEKDLSEEFKKRILDFWEWTYKKQTDIKKKLGDIYDSFLGHMAKLAILLTKIDKDNCDWLMLSAPYIDIQHNSSLFIEYLTQFLDDDESVKYIGKIYREMLKNTTPTFKTEDIILIVEKIFEKGDWNDAAEICNTYGRRGVHFLKDTFFKYQEKRK